MNTELACTSVALVCWGGEPLQTNSCAFTIRRGVTAGASASPLAHNFSQVRLCVF